MGDLRFPVTIEQWQAEALIPTFTATGSHYWRYVPAATFLMGSDSSKDELSLANEYPQHQVTLPAYYIARYPTTNAQYAQFINAGGYTEERWWSWSDQALGWWRENEPEGPIFWDDDRLNNFLQPVVGVTWYEAVAYTRWLATEMQSVGALAGHETVRLPTEEEWEYAARGIDGRIYPWGKFWRIDHCNSKESRIDLPTTVGCFPAGASPWGVMDMAGNVWEWCANYEYAYSDGLESFDWHRNMPRMIRGGSCSHDNQSARCAAREWAAADNDFFSDNQGFRCVIVLRAE